MRSHMPKRSSVAATEGRQAGDYYTERPAVLNMVRPSVAAGMHTLRASCLQTSATNANRGY